MAITTAAAPQLPTGDPIARVFSEHAQFVFRTAYGVTGSHEDAEDVLQTVFLDAWVIERAEKPTEN